MDRYDACPLIPSTGRFRRQAERPYDRPEITAFQPGNPPIGFELRHISRYDVSIAPRSKTKRTDRFSTKG
jgi:hypothetical protein